MEEPEQAARLVWAEEIAKPQVMLVGELYDLVEAVVMMRAGQDRGQPILARMMQRQAGADEGVKAAAPARRRKTAQEIRAQLERAQRK